MSKEDEVERDPFEAYARGDDIDDSERILTEKPDRPIVGEN